MFELDETERLVQKTARDFATRVLAPRAAERDRLELFPVEELRSLAELGLLGLNFALVLQGSGLLLSGVGNPCWQGVHRSLCGLAERQQVVALGVE